MQIQPGTTYTITDGFNIAVIPLLEQSHSLVGKDMQGVWNTVKGYSNIPLCKPNKLWAGSLLLSAQTSLSRP